MTKKELVAILDRWLLGEYIGDDKEILGRVSGGAMTDIKKAMIEPAPDLAIFILGACFIDAMASFRYAVTEGMLTDHFSGDRFKKFTLAYLPKEYHSDSGNDFYKSLRCGLVHNYTEQRGRYAFLSGDSNMHHGKTESGKIIIHRGKFIIELIAAYKKLVCDILNNEEVFINAKARYDSLGLMRCPITNMYPKTEPDQFNP